MDDLGKVTPEVAGLRRRADVAEVLVCWFEGRFGKRVNDMTDDEAEAALAEVMSDEEDGE